ncbi:MAG: class I SAM-dependent methyltransferase [Gemmataceae bacterium]|nr:class I SAM-dependent methyltransferase [Gemmataceae bacterium]
MNHFLYGVAKALTETFDLAGPVVEIGSLQVAGGEAVADLRPLFPGRRYLGLDRRAGPGVDCVADVENLPLADASVGTVVAMSTFEHVRRFWRGFAEVRRVLRPDGAFLLCCPFFFRLHEFPQDYWRFSPTALEFLLEDYPSKIIGWHGAKKRPANVWALALGPQRAPIQPHEFRCYCERVQRYAREPRRSLTRRWRYRLAALLCHRGPFAPYLDHDRWESTCSSLALKHGSV